MLVNQPLQGQGLSALAYAACLHFSLQHSSLQLLSINAILIAVNCIAF